MHGGDDYDDFGKSFGRRKQGKRTQRLTSEMHSADGHSDSSCAGKRRSHRVREPMIEQSPLDKMVERLPRDVMLVVVAHLRPPEIVSFLNSSPRLRRRIDTKELWKGSWYWLAEEFSGAVTVHRLLSRIGHGDAFDWKMLVLLDWRFQYKDLTYKTIRSSAKEWCAKIREVGLVFEVSNTDAAISQVHSLLQSLRHIDSALLPNDEETVSTEDEYDHDRDWELAIVSSMALAKVRCRALSQLSLPQGVNVDRLVNHYEEIFASYKDLAPETHAPDTESLEY
eukprot:TRINITY_DN10827_c0_g1_i2.p1 TRINITY_DN10827_c0_g1~~TRINITY_DN10827_c0_g1_i2.p1  ORF type:complete len:281 (+),score=82.63 TRINITY_DN10827_c0_g1_i2:332-1174(+)